MYISLLFVPNKFYLFPRVPENKCLSTNLHLIRRPIYIMYIVGQSSPLKFIIDFCSNKTDFQVLLWYVFITL
jgi:hypothetical protein